MCSDAVEGNLCDSPQKRESAGRISQDNIERKCTHYLN